MTSPWLILGSGPTAADDYESVKADIAAYLPKVKSGGWIGGHDYQHGNGFSVCEAVDAWRKRHGFTMQLDKGLTWWVNKINGGE